MVISRKILVSISVLVSGVIIVIMFYHIRNRKWFDSHKYIYEISKQESYTIKRITDKRLTYHFGDEFATGSTNLNDRIDGYIFYDTLQHTFWIETTEYIIPEEEEGIVYENTEWVSIDLNGNVMDKREEVDSIAHNSWVLLKTEITNFYKWKDESTFFVQHFARERFNWDSLNPLRNYGSPTGGTPSTYWEGVAYLTLQMERSTIQFKTKTSTTDRSYSFSIDLYRVPPRYQSGRELAFLYIDEHYLNHKDKGLYLIMQ